MLADKLGNSQQMQGHPKRPMIRKNKGKGFAISRA
jgi:hypothetical protein